MKLGGYNWVNQSAIGPTNEHSVNVAQNTLNNTISRANKQLMNALEVDGFKVFLYRRVLGGSQCPCTRQLDVRRDYEATKAQVSNEITFEFAGGRDDGYNLNLNDPDPSEDDNFNITNSNPNDVLNSAFTEEESRLMGNPLAPFSADSTACGICMNTKRTQGYALFHGERMVLCASDDYPFELHRGAMYNKETPQGFILDNGAEVVWDVELPTYTHAESVSVFNNRKRSNNVGAWYSADGGKEWFPLTMEAINKKHGKPKRWKIKAAQFEKDSKTEFTHINLILVDGKLPKVQVPNISQDIVMEDFAPPVTQSFVFPPTMFNIERESVFYDCKYGFLWKVTGVFQQKTTTGQIFGYNVTARVVQPAEVFWQLRENMLSTMDVAFRGLEEYQGGAIVEENARINKPMLDRVHTFTPYRERFDYGKVGDANDDGGNNGNSSNKCDKCPASYDQSPSNGSSNQVVCTAGNCVMASANSVVPGSVLTEAFDPGKIDSFNNGGATLDKFGNVVKGSGEHESHQYPYSPTTNNSSDNQTNDEDTNIPF